MKDTAAQVFCLCGYPRKGIASSDPCPECGGYDRLVDHPRLRRTERWLSWIALAFSGLMLLLLLSMIILNSMEPVGFAMQFGCLGILVGFASVVFTTVRCRQRGKRVFASRALRLGLVSILVPLLAYAVFMVLVSSDFMAGI